MPCFRCKRTGEMICDAEEAELRCEVCGACEAGVDTMCFGPPECDRKYDCMRAMIKPRKYGQTYMNFYKNGKCEDYVKCV